MSASPQQTKARREEERTSSSSTSSGGCLAVDELQRIANKSLQSRSVQVTGLEGYTCLTYELRTSPNFFYLLRCTPPSSVQLLRLEERQVQNEVAALQALKGRSDHIHTRVIDYQHDRTRHGFLYNVTGPFTGNILGNIEEQLSDDRKSVLETGLGRFMQHLSTIIGPSFGPLHRAPLLPQTWSAVFTGALQSLLRDGEEALVDLPYHAIRNMLHQHRSSLDRIATPRLVILDAISHANVVVSDSHDRVTGLLEYSTAMWGDPLMSDCFYRPTPDFLLGFGEPIIKPSSGERARKSLYVVYHSVLSIVRHNYRPEESARVTGDEAREDLKTALRELETA